MEQNELKNNIKISMQELIDSYKKSIGEEGAKELVQSAVRKAGLAFSREYTKDDAIKILKVLQKEEGFVGILAGIIIPRIIIRK